MPEGTIFSNFEPCIFKGLRVHAGRVGSNDFNYEEIIGAIDASSPEDYESKADWSMKGHGSLEMDFDDTRRDGSYTDEYFAVLEKEDVEKLIEKLKVSLKIAYKAVEEFLEPQEVKDSGIKITDRRILLWHQLVINTLPHNGENSISIEAWVENCAHLLKHPYHAWSGCFGEGDEITKLLRKLLTRTMVRLCGRVLTVAPLPEKAVDLMFCCRHRKIVEHYTDWLDVSVHDNRIVELDLEGVGLIEDLTDHFSKEVDAKTILDRWASSRKKD